MHPSQMSPNQRHALVQIHPEHSHARSYTYGTSHKYHTGTTQLCAQPPQPTRHLRGAGERDLISCNTFKPLWMVHCSGYCLAPRWLKAGADWYLFTFFLRFCLSVSLSFSISLFLLYSHSHSFTHSLSLLGGENKWAKNRYRRKPAEPGTRRAGTNKTASVIILCFFSSGDQRQLDLTAPGGTFINLKEKETKVAYLTKVCGTILLSVFLRNYLRIF